MFLLYLFNRCGSRCTDAGEGSIGDPYKRDTGHLCVTRARLAAERYMLGKAFQKKESEMVG